MLLKNIHDITSSSFHHFVQQRVPRKMRQEDVSFFSKETQKTRKNIIDAKKEGSREERFFIRKEKLHTHNTLAAFNSLLYK